MRLRTYAAPKGHTFLDRALYLPQEWADDLERREHACVPEEIEFATKPQLAQAMLKRALDAGVPAAWVTADSVYGDDPGLRAFLEERGQAYVMAIASDQRLPLGEGGIRALTLAPRLPASAWQTLSAGEGAKGARLYDWACQALDAPDQSGWSRGLLVRRSLTDPSELAYDHVFAPENTPLLRLVEVAGTRWTVECCLESAKGEVGLDHYEVRRWQGWYRHITLSLWAHAFLTVLRAQLLEWDVQKGGEDCPFVSEGVQALPGSAGADAVAVSREPISRATRNDPEPAGADAVALSPSTEGIAVLEEKMVPLRCVVSWSVAELGHLLGCIALVLPLEARHYRLWSRWRRVHQAIARAFHSRRRLARTVKVQL